MNYTKLLATGLFVLITTTLLGGCGTGSKGAVALRSDVPTMGELQARLQSEFERLGIDPDKVPAQAPSGEDNYVFDLTAAVIDPDGEGGDPATGIELRFTERVVGDYDQNGEVNIADLTPMGMRFFQTVGYDAPDLHNGLTYWPTGSPDDDGGAGSGNPPAAGSAAINWRNARIDGDFNGEINIADITPIATHWNHKLSGYKVFRKGPGDDSYHMIPKPGDAASPVSLSRPVVDNNRPVRYVMADNQTENGSYEYYVSAFDSIAGSEGPQSLHAIAVIDNGGGPGNDPPIAALIANPTSGDEPLDVTLDASGSVDTDGSITKYEWDWDGDGTFDFDSGTDNSVAHTYLAAGGYNPAVRVTDNENATDTQSTTVTVNAVGPNTDPIADVTANPTEGDAALDVAFNGSGSSDPDGTIVQYEWDWTGDGSYDASGASATINHLYTVGGNYMARMRVTDNRGGTDTDTVQIIIHGTVPTNPVAALVADPTTGNPPLNVNFDASGSTDDGNITDYEWDLDGDGTFNEAPEEASFRGTSTASYNYADPGIYPASVRVTDNDDLTDTASQAINVAVHGWYVVPIIAMGDRGKYCKLVVVDGKPAVCYFSFFPNGLFYVRALDDDGLSWSAEGSGSTNPPLHLDNTPNSGYWNSMAIVDGNPAISYYQDDQDTGWPLKYIRATDPQGSAWGAPQELDDVGTITFPGGYTSMQIIEGNPAIAFFDASGPGSRFLRANDAQGSSWPASSVTISSGTNAGFYLSMAIVNGNPAVAYLDQGARDLKYARATNATGTSWGAPMQIDYNGDRWWTGTHTCLTVLDGKPCVSYSYLADHSGDGGPPPDSSLCFMQANDANGSAWGSRQELDGTGSDFHGRWTSMSIFEGFPIIAYMDQDPPYEVRVIRSTDLGGDAGTWSPYELVGDAGNQSSGYTSFAVVNNRMAMTWYDALDKNLMYAVYFE